MSSKIYFYDTIEECEKEIVDKTIIMDINHASNLNLFECFVRLIRTIMIWTTFIYTGISFYNNGTKTGFKALGICICIYLIWALLISWVKHNYEETFVKIKVQLVNNMILHCKEFNEDKYEDWQVKQMIKRFEKLARLK